MSDQNHEKNRLILQPPFASGLYARGEFQPQVDAVVAETKDRFHRWLATGEAWTFDAKQPGVPPCFIDDLDLRANCCQWLDRVRARAEFRADGFECDSRALLIVCMVLEGLGHLRLDTRAGGVTAARPAWIASGESGAT